MTDLSITAANVLAGGTANTETGVAGATVTAGQCVYKEAASKSFKLSDSDSGTAEANAVYGIALHASLAGQPLTVCTGGPVTIGATLTAGSPYYLSATAGGIAPEADLTTGDKVVFLGHAISTSVLDLRISATGVTL